MNNKYLSAIFSLLLVSLPLEQASSSTLNAHYQDVNHVLWSTPFSPLSGGLGMGAGIYYSSSSLMSTVPALNGQPNLNKLIRVDDVSSTEHQNYTQDNVENIYLKRNVLSFPDEIFEQILQTNPRPSLSFRRLDLNSHLTGDCAVSNVSVLGDRNDANVEQIQEGLEHVSAQNQYCRYEFDNIDPVKASLQFCGCVRSRTNQFGDAENVIYPAMKEDDVFKNAASVFKQRFADLVISDIFDELTAMTDQANAFLATEELGDLLYGKFEDSNTNMTLDFVETRQRMHACSGVGMRDFVDDMFMPGQDGKALCDSQSADILLTSIKNYNSCGEESLDQCDDLSSFASHQSYREHPSDEVISDLMTFHFSKNIVRADDVFSLVATDAAPFDKYRAVISTVSMMSSQDENNRSVLLRERVNARKMLPNDNELLSLSKLVAQVEAGREIDFSVLSDDEFNQIHRTLVTNPLYKDAKRENEFERKLQDKRQMVSNFVHSLNRDKALRISQDANFARYFQNDDPLAATKVLVINNYLERSEDLGLRCEAVKDKVRTLCSSMKGNGIALFSHPDFREQAEKFIVDENLHKEINTITQSNRERSPVVDQLFCHANYASIGNACQETLRQRYNVGASFSQCAYDTSWLLKHLDPELASGAEGNVEESHIMTMRRQREAQAVKAASSSSNISSSGRAFASIVSTEGELKSNYGGNSRTSDNSRSPASFIGEDMKGELSTVGHNLALPTASDATSSAEAPIYSSFQYSMQAQNSFAEQFAQNSMLPVAPIANTSPAVNENLADRHVTSTSQPDAATEMLLNELRASERQQQQYLEQLEALRNKKNSAQSKAERDEMREKELEIAKLDDRVKNLRTQVQQRQQESSRQSETRALSTPSSSSIARSPAATPTPTPTATGQSSFQSSSSSGGGSAAVTSNQSSSTAQASRPSQAVSQGLTLSAQSNQLISAESNLSQVARSLTGRDYVLRDVGIPGKAEKIVFETRNGEIVMVDGEPRIASVELIDLIPDALAQEVVDDAAPEIQARAPASEQRREAYWDEVLDLIKKNVTK